jgi:hypothetical protein
MIMGGGGVLLVCVFKISIYAQYSPNRSTNFEVLKESLLPFFHFCEKSGPPYVLRYKIGSAQVKYMPAIVSSRKLISGYPFFQ